MSWLEIAGFLILCKPFLAYTEIDNFLRIVSDKEVPRQVVSFSLCCYSTTKGCITEV